MAKPLKIRDDRSPAELRRAARRERDGRAAARMCAIANALKGMSRAESARLAGMERQALRDAVMRYNAEGPAGLHDRPGRGPKTRLDEGEQVSLVAVILNEPVSERDGVWRWQLVDLQRLVAERFGVRYSISGRAELLHRLDVAWMSVRPAHPEGDPAASPRSSSCDPHGPIP